MLRDYVDRGQSTGSQRRELGALIAAVNHWLRENDPMGTRQQIAMMRPKENPGRDREVPIMCDTTMGDLVERMRLHGRDELFRCPSGTPWTRNNLASQWDSYKALAGLVDLQWTDLRHTFATRLGMAGVNATTIADLLGHTNLGLVQRYVQVTSLDREAAVRHAIV